MASAYVEIPLGGKKAAGRAAKIDVDDYELVSKHNWFAKEDPNSGLYAATNVPVRDGGPYRQRTLRMHRLLSDHKVVDHANNDGLDNRRSNLREGADGKNAKNRRPNRRGSSGYRGVCWFKGTGKWRAYIMCDGKRFHLGYFEDKDEAARTYDAKAVELYGKYAYLNFPDEITQSSP